MREHLVPGQAAARPRALRVARRDEHRRPRRVARRAADRRRLVRDYADVYHLTAEQLANADEHVRARGARRSSGGSVRRTRRRSSNRSRAAGPTSSGAVIYGLGIRHIGERGAQVLARAFGSMDALDAASLEQLQATNEIGPVLAESARSWLDEPRNRELVSTASRGRCPHGGARIRTRERRTGAVDRQEPT